MYVYEKKNYIFLILLQSNHMYERDNIDLKKHRTPLFLTNTCVFINVAGVGVAPGGFICGNKGGGREWKFFIHTISVYFFL